MTPNDITLHAFNGTYPDEPMNMPEMLLYKEIENISLKYKHGIITKDAATDLKTKALADYAGNLVDYRNGIEAMQDKGNFYKRIELATSAYRLNKTIENADKILEVVYDI